MRNWLVGPAFSGFLAAVVAAGGASAQVDQPESQLASDETIARFEELLRRRPFHESAFEAIASQYADEGRLGDLIDRYEEMHASLPDDSGIRILLVRVLTRAGDADRAAEILDGFDTSEIGDDEQKLLVLWSEIESARGNQQRGIELLVQARDAAERLSDRVELSEALASFYLRIGDQESAAKTLAETAEWAPAEYIHVKRVADSMSQRGLHSAAVEMYGRVLELVGGQTDRRVEVLRQLGLAHERLSEPDEALESYTTAIDLLSDDHWLRRELSQRIVSLYRSGGRLDELEAYCRTRIERSPAQTSSRVLLAEVLEALERHDEARQTLVTATELFPDDQEISERLIGLLERQNDIDAVSAEYERIIARHPRDLDLYIAFGQILFQEEQVEAARRQWEHVLTSDAVDVSMALRLASLFEPREMFDDAVSCYERAIELAPDQPRAYTSLARLWMLRGEEAEARTTLARLAEATPDDPSAHAERSRALQSLGDQDAALDAMARASELDPENVQFRVDRADLLLQLGRGDEALEIRRGTLQIIKNPVAQASAIEALVSMHAGRSGLEALEEAELQLLDQDPDSGISLLLLATIADQQREFPKSRQWLERLLEAEPDHEEARSRLARLHEAIGDIDAAVAEYQLLIQQHPGRARQYYQAVVDAMVRHDDTYGAVQTLEKMILASPDNVTVLDEVAEQLLRLGEVERALEIYSRAVGLQPDRYETRLAYAEALRQNGQFELAVPELRAAALQTRDRDTSASALAALHDVAGQLGQLESLLDELESVVRADPDQTLIAALAAQLLIEEYEYDRAITLLDHVLRANPRDAEVHIARASLLRRLARYDEAIDSYQRVLRFPGADQDFVLGELGKAVFEAGRREQAGRVWSQIANKQFAGSLFRNNGYLDEAIAVLSDGIRIKPDDAQLHRTLIRTLEQAGKEDEALFASRRLLDLEPNNAQHVIELADRYIQRGDRVAAADIASRLFSAAIVHDHSQNNQYQGYNSYAMMSAMYPGYYGQSPRSNLDTAVDYFSRNRLVAELRQVIEEQLLSQPDNALLHMKAMELYSDDLAEPELALGLIEKLKMLEFPLEHQAWLGTSSQADYMRSVEYALVASMPGLRDAKLSGIDVNGDLDQHQLTELGIIRLAQGDLVDAAALLRRAHSQDPSDVLVHSILAQTLLATEDYESAIPVLESLRDSLEQKQAAMLDETVERVRRDYVRTLPVPLQARVDDQMLVQIAQMMMRGSSAFDAWGTGTEIMGLHRVRMALAEAYAETDQIESARREWKAAEPTAEADADSWAELGTAVQEFEQDDLAYEYYLSAIEASRLRRSDPLLMQIYSSARQMRSWYSQEENVIDSSFNRLLRSFSQNDALVELYDFLRDQEQSSRAEQIARIYKLDDQLTEHYRDRVTAARQAFLASGDDPIVASTEYLAEVCKLAEVYDRSQRWDDAEAVYQSYLKDFPDEVALLLTLGDVSERQGDIEGAIEYQKLVIEASRRVATKARAWSLRQLLIVPARPDLLEDSIQSWEWQSRWGRQSWRSRGVSTDESAAWLRLANLYLADQNVIAAGDAMSNSIRESRQSRSRVVSQVLSLIKSRQLVAEMLPVLRSMAVRAPSNEGIQVAFAESLEANDRDELAVEVYQRLLRSGVSDIETLTIVRNRLTALAPDDAAVQGETLESLAESVAASPGDAGEQFRLAKAYYYSLKPEEALNVLDTVDALAPNMIEALDLRFEICTLLDRQDEILELLERKIRLATGDEKNAAKQAYVQQLLRTGRTEEAIENLKDLADPSDPDSYTQIGILLHYFGRHEEALEQFKASSKGQHGGMMSWMGGESSDTNIARSYALTGQDELASEQILKAVLLSAQQASMQMSMMGGMFEQEMESHFEPYLTIFLLNPGIADLVEAQLEFNHKDDPYDMTTAKLLIDFYQQVGKPERAFGMLDDLAGTGGGDQQIVQMLIDRAIQDEAFDRAIELGESFIKRQPKPTLPPGMPPQYAAMMSVFTPRNIMLCKLADVHWKRGDHDLAMETYRRMVDEDIDATRIAYASVCLVRDRIDEAEQIIDEALAEQEIRSPDLLQFKALIVGLRNDNRQLFDLLVEADQASVEDEYSYADSAGDLLRVLGNAPSMRDHYIDYLSSKVDESPNSWDRQDLLISTLREFGRIDEANKLLESAINVRAFEKDALTRKYYFTYEQLSDEERLDMLAKLAELSDQEVGANDVRGGWYNSYGGTDAAEYYDDMADILWDMDRRDEAIEHWLRRADLSASSTHLELAQKLSARDAWDQASTYLERALELAPTDSEARLQMARYCVYKGDYAGALDNLVEVFRESTLMSTNYSYYWRYYRQQDEIDPRYAVAALIEQSGEGPSALAALDDERRSDAELMLALWTGRWSDADELLAERLADSPYDPTIWSMRLKCKQQSDDSLALLQAMEDVRRLKSTSLMQRHEQLELVLAGRQIQEAMGQASGAGAGQPQYSSYQSFGSSRYGRSDDDTKNLANLYIQLGNHEQAERLILSNELSGYEINTLARLMNSQGRAERALELTRFSLIMGQTYGNVTRYATMLADNGRVDESIDLLIRAYRYAADNDSDQYRYYYRYYGSSDANLPQLESQDEARYSRSIYSVLDEAGKLDETIDQLLARAKADPEDGPAFRLSVSLMLKADRLDEAEAFLNERAAADPGDPAISNLLYTMALDRHDPDAAIAALAGLEGVLSEVDLRHRKALAMLAGGQREAAAELLNEGDPDGQSDTRLGRQIMLLIASEQIDRAASLIESADDERYRHALAVLQSDQVDWQQNFDSTVKEFWSLGGVLDAEGGSLNAMVALVDAADEVGAAIDPSSDVNAAVLQLARGDIAGAHSAFTEVLASDPDNVDAMRGLVMTNELIGDLDSRVACYEQMVNWLEQHKNDVWRDDEGNSPSESIQSALTEMREADMDTQSLLSMSMGYGGSMLSEALDTYSESSSPSTFETLIGPYTHRYQSCLAAAGRFEKLESMFEESWEVVDQELPDYVRQMIQMNPSLSASDFSDMFGGGDYEVRTIDDVLIGAGAYEYYLNRRDDHIARVEPENWVNQSRARAALGAADLSDSYLQSAGVAAVASLRNSDQPGSQDSGYYGNGFDYDSWQSDFQLEAVYIESHMGSQYDSWNSTQAWWLSTRSELSSQRLSDLADSIGPSWADSRTMSQAINMLLAQGDDERLIELYERVYPETEELVESDAVPGYVAACIRAESYDRLDRVIEAVESMGQSWEDESELLRLCVLRLRGSTPEADALESAIIESCKSTDHQLLIEDKELVGRLRGSGPQAFYAMQHTGWDGHAGYPISVDSALTLSSLKSVLGIESLNNHEGNAHRLERIESWYSRFGLHEDALRILDVQDEHDDGDSEYRDHRRVACLYELGRKDEANEIAERLQNPDSLVSAYMSASRWGYYGVDEQNDPSNALDRLRESKHESGLIDPHGLYEASLLFELENYEEAWMLYNRAIETGHLPYSSAAVLYRAGLSKWEAEGETDSRLLNLALWYDPESKLSERAQEALR